MKFWSIDETGVHKIETTDFSVLSLYESITCVNIDAIKKDTIKKSLVAIRVQLSMLLIYGQKLS